MQKKNGVAEFHHFMKNEILNNSSKTFLSQWEPMGFCKQKKCEKISTTRLKHVDYLHSSSIYPQESENKTEKRRKPKVKIISHHSSPKLVGLAHFLQHKERKVAGIFLSVRQVS